MQVVEKGAKNVIDLDIPTLGRPLPIKLSQIEPYPDQPRKWYDLGALESLADSIQSEGQKTPCRVFRHPDKPGVFVLIGGERRWRAFNIILKRTGKEPVVNCFVDSIRTAKEHFREAFLDNIQREDLCVVDEASGYARLQRDGMTVAQIADLVKRSVTHVDNYLRISALPDSVKKLMDPSLAKDKRLQTTVAIEIARSTTDVDLATEIAQESVVRNLGVLESKTLIAARIPVKGPREGPGRKRRASDNYEVFSAFLKRTESLLGLHMGNMDVAELYVTRENEEDDRGRDTKIIDSIISALEEARKKVSETNVARIKRQGHL